MKKMVMYIIETVVILLITFVVFDKMVIPVTITGTSMESTLKDGSVALVNGLSVKEDNIERFDVVVAYSSLLKENIIKRVIGLPGDKVAMVNDVLYINDVICEESYLDDDFIIESKLRYNKDFFTDDFEITLLEDEYFLLGDNRLNSTDSRVLGPFSLDDIVGIGGLVIYPFDCIEWMSE